MTVSASATLTKYVLTSGASWTIPAGEKIVWTGLDSTDAIVVITMTVGSNVE